MFMSKCTHKQLKFRRERERGQSILEVHGSGNWRIIFLSLRRLEVLGNYARMKGKLLKQLRTASQDRRKLDLGENGGERMCKGLPDGPADEQEEKVVEKKEDGGWWSLATSQTETPITRAHTIVRRRLGLRSPGRPHGRCNRRSSLYLCQCQCPSHRHQCYFALSAEH